MIAEKHQYSQQNDRYIDQQAKQNKETNVKEFEDIQNYHNDNHIFYGLRTAGCQIYNDSQFNRILQQDSYNGKYTKMKLFPQNNFRKILNLQNSKVYFKQVKKQVSERSSSKSLRSQRENTKLLVNYQKNSENSNKKISESSRNKHRTQNQVNSTKRQAKLERIRKRNSFNVKQFINEQQIKKNDNYRIQFKDGSIKYKDGSIQCKDGLIQYNDGSNMSVKRIKSKIWNKILLSPQKIKNCQFNAIDVTKNIILKNSQRYEAIQKIRDIQRKEYLKPNKSFNEGTKCNKKDVQIRKVTDVYFLNRQKNQGNEQKGSLWRSNSYQLSKRNKEENTSLNRNSSFKYEKSEQVMDLNPWHSEFQGQNENKKSGSKGSKYQQDNQFFTQYMRTSRYNCK